ncbi:MAG: redoxin domain-containing protein [Candidatus Marinimicrobia bacterium]|nr:redoxin domain-containing protein [Candidatus Neomarinimicrobiota bacterium]
MKKYLILLLITIAFISCGKETLKDQSKVSKPQESILMIEDDGAFLKKAIPIIKGKKVSEMELIQIAERTLKITISTDESNYNIAKKYLSECPNKFFSAMSLNSVVWENRENEKLFKKTNELINIANNFTYTKGFADSGLSYFDSRGYAPEEKNEALSAYRGMIRDTYAVYLVKQGKIEEAIKTYETVLKEYEETGILLNYATLLNKMNRYKEALEATITALRATTGSEEVKDSLRVYAKNLAYSETEINAIIDEAIQGGRSELKEELLADKLDIPMPSFELLSLNGRLVNSKEFIGKILIVDFWATWCAPCIKEFPHLNELLKKYASDDDIRIIAISTDQDREKVAPFIEENNYQMSIFYNDNTSKAFGVNGIPTLFVVDKKGIIRYKKVGFTEGEEFVKIMGWYIDSLK